MNQRERYLAIGVGGLLVVVLAQWCFTQYRDAVQFRQNRLSSLTSEAETMQMRWLAGAEAERQLGEYKVRSLSSNPQVAQNSYQSWLLDTVRATGIQDAVVDPVSDVPVGDLYRRFAFRVSGKTDLPGVIDLVYAVQAHDQLHRIRELLFAPVRQSGRRVKEDAAATEDMLSIVMVIDAISLNIADAKPTVPTEEPSWRISQSYEQYQQDILNRNFFEPPNQPPRYRGDERLVATMGRSNEFKFQFEDPEGDSIEVKVEGDLPPWASWNQDSQRLVVTPPAPPKKPEPAKTAEGSAPAEESDYADTNSADSDAGDSNSAESDSSADSDPPASDTPSDTPAAPKPAQPFSFELVAIDNGYPNRQSTRTVTITPQVAPIPPPPVIREGFDDSTQTFLTALVQGRDDWTAWMSVRTRGKTLKLKIGDEFEIGSVSGKVTAVSNRSVTLEIDGQPYELKPAQKLSDVMQ
ncbi:hypothetical protein [Neorhodopirellula lusitana]|uniref:hypothetical protein n=1 Tax=Neorhodopirellula lusitana TaxID=445327 RepID=UPI00384F2402